MKNRSFHRENILSRCCHSRPFRSVAAFLRLQSIGQKNFTYLSANSLVDRCEVTARTLRERVQQKFDVPRLCDVGRSRNLGEGFPPTLITCLWWSVRRWRRWPRSDRWAPSMSCRPGPTRIRSRYSRCRKSPRQPSEKGEKEKIEHHLPSCSQNWHLTPPTPISR